MSTQDIGIMDSQRESQSSSQPKVIAVVQARLGSVRFPSKVLQPILGVPNLKHLIDRLRRSKKLSAIVLAIPDSSENDVLEELGSELGVHVVRGSEVDVLKRYALAARSQNADVVVRITADCPMVDPEVVDQVIQILSLNKVKNCFTADSFPDGFDVEAFLAEDLFLAEREATDPFDREHVTPFIRRLRKDESTEIRPTEDLSHIRLTIDEPVDYEVVRNVFEEFGTNRFSIGDVQRLVKSQPDLFRPNLHLGRNEGAMMSTGQKLWGRAKKRIPGGSMLLSKRAELHAPKGWPAYFSRTSGCSVWDLDDRHFYDFYMMGVGTNTLGYSHPQVDEAVLNVIRNGNLSTLNCPEEVYLAEELCVLHPWAEMVRYTRSGGEACAVAVRIARAAAGRDNVAFCGYHGWHDWYLSANLGSSSALDGHLLPGLDPKGVPRELAGTSFPFQYNDIASLEKLLTDHDVGVIFMEVQRGTPPVEGFLAEVRQLADKYSAVLVFDECTSGFRKVLGGLHMHYGVEPDIVVLGKTLGNGYAINAVVGRSSVMQSAQDTFISSTFWTERIGPTAALATLKVMREEDVPNRIDLIGMAIRQGWAAIAKDSGLQIRLSGLPALSVLEVEGLESLEFKTYVTNEMLKKGFLAGNLFYASVAHTELLMDKYLEALSEVFQEIGKNVAMGSERPRLVEDMSQAGFRRLV
jgi:glutamate-1-semialdehyde 2,1-aminomutase